MAAALGTEVEIRPGRTGSFEITVDGELVYSKLATRRFPEEAELDAIARPPGD